ncbi:hypothetical protein K7432_017038, partial [Basidiobolus ranarum]
VAQFFYECVEFVRTQGIEVEGIFRRSPSSSALKEAKETYNRGNCLDLEEYGVHVAAVLLKMFFRELPTPVFSAENYVTIRDMRSCTNDTESIQYIRTNIFQNFSKPTLVLLAQIFRLMNDISAKSSINLMTPYNLAVVWSPNLVRSGNPMVDVSMCTVGAGTVGSIVRLCIEYVDVLFPESLYPHLVPDDIGSKHATKSNAVSAATTQGNGFESWKDGSRSERPKSMAPKKLYRASTSEDVGINPAKLKRYSAYFPKRDIQEY